MACQVALISDTVFSVLPLMSILHLLVESELVCVEEDCFPHSKVPSEEDGPAGEIKKRNNKQIMLETSLQQQQSKSEYCENCRLYK